MKHGLQKPSLLGFSVAHPFQYLGNRVLRAGGEDHGYCAEGLLFPCSLRLGGLASPYGCLCRQRLLFVEADGGEQQPGSGFGGNRHRFYQLHPAHGSPVGLSYLEHLVDVGSAAHHHFGPLVHVCGLHRPPGRGDCRGQEAPGCRLRNHLLRQRTLGSSSLPAGGAPSIPVVISSEGMGLTAKMRVAMFLSVGVFSLLYLYLLKTRMKSLVLQERVARLKAELMA